MERGHANRVILGGMLELHYRLPVSLILPLTIAIVALSVEIGYRAGRRERLRPRHESETLVSDLTTPAIGLFGLMLAFTFGWAATRFDMRHRTRIDEAQAIERLFHL